MDRNGFTLLEIIIVLLIVSLIAGVGAARLRASGGEREARTAALELASALRRTRSEAIRRNLDLALLIDVDARSYRVPGRAPRRLDRDLEIQLEAAAEERRDPASAGIRFFADGSATGGSIALRTSGGGRQTVDVDWLSGRVEVRGGAGGEERHAR
jgi:general secretion pathway protein H